MILFLVAAIILSSCATSNIYMEVLKPAHVTVPREIRKLVITNRSLPDEDSKVTNIIEGIITGEGVFVDKFGSEECIRGLQEALKGSERYPEVMLPDNIDLRAKGAGQWPPLLDWNEVGRICRKYNADALVTLANFDSDNDVRFSKVAREVEKHGRKVMVNSYVAHMRIGVTSGWRIYYPDEQMVVDANSYKDYRSWEAEGKTERAAATHLLQMRDAVGETGYFAGQQYASRISPTWIRVGRTYYRKPGDDFEKAQRFVQHNKWEQAAEIWINYVEHADPKLAGRACYNMALAIEMEGDLKGAREWVKKAYYDYDIKKADQYIRILNTRIRDQQKLQKQLGD